MTSGRISRQTCLFLAALVVAVPRLASAQDALPAKIQVVLFKKIFQYNRALPEGKKPRIAVLEGPGAEEAPRLELPSAKSLISTQAPLSLGKLYRRAFGGPFLSDWLFVQANGGSLERELGFDYVFDTNFTADLTIVSLQPFFRSLEC